MHPEKMVTVVCLGLVLVLAGCESADESGTGNGDTPELDVTTSADGSGGDVSAPVDGSGDPAVPDAAGADGGVSPPETSDVAVSPSNGDSTGTVDAATPVEDTKEPPDEPPAVPCEGENPAGCFQNGCPAGMVCKVGQECTPSACFCDAGSWTCTEDCGGGSCVSGGDEPVDPSLCETPNPASCSVPGVKCPAGQVCDEDAGCAPSNCQCSDLGIWSCTADCVAGICVPNVVDPTPVDPSGCTEPNPASCLFVECPDGFTCDEDAPGCSPSTCSCEAGPDGFEWACKKDCHPGKCVPAVPMPPTPGFCPKPGPASCVENGCPGNMVCDLEAGCGPSECTCNMDEGAWECTDDCVPGICIPKPPGPGPGDPEPPVGCPEGEVPTALGCMTCEAVMAHIAEKMPFVEGGADKCIEDAECVLSDGGTACMGTCPISVNGQWEEIYLAKKQTLSDDFCTGYAEECGYATPSCMQAEPQCIDGLCEAVLVTE